MVESLLQWAVPGGVAALITGLFLLASKRRDARTETEQKALPTWTEAMKENRELRGELTEFREEFKEYKKATDLELRDLRSEMERQMGATRRVFRDVARQWVGSGPPVLHPDDIAVLSDTLPAAWRAN